MSSAVGQSGAEKLEKEKEKEEKKEAKKEEELSEEDQKLKTDLEMLVERLEEADKSLYKAALQSLKDQIRSSTTSVTSVPKPLKFLRPHYARLKAVHGKLEAGPDKSLCASVLSALAMTVKGDREVLKYRLLGLEEDVAAWGQEYVKHLSAELGEEWNAVAEAEAAAKDKAKAAEEKKAEKERLLTLAKDIVQYYLKHNSEVEACDLLMEMGQAELVLEMGDEGSFQRMGLYLVSCAPYLPEPDNTTILTTAMRLYTRFDQPVQALVCAAMLNDLGQMKRMFLQCQDPVVQRQMAIILGRQQVFLDIPEDTPNQADLVALNSNSSLSQYFQILARELDIQEPKVPEDIYKTHLEQSRSSASGVDSAKANLAASFVNGFVNAGFGKEKMMGEDPTKWFYKNKDMGMLSAAASVGLIHRWDIDTGLSKVDSSLYSSENMVKAGTMMAIGIISSGIFHDCDPAQALLADYLEAGQGEQAPADVIRVGAIFGLGLAYTNSSRDSVLTEVLPRLKRVLEEPLGTAGTTHEVQSLAALSIGLIRVGTGCEDASKALSKFLSTRPSVALNNEHNYRLAGLGLALIWLGRQKDAAEVVKKMKDLPAPYGPTISTLVDVCAYAATGNVLKIQEMLHICSEHHEKEEDKKDDKAKDKKDAGKKPEKKEEKKELSGQQAVAALGVGLIAMGEDIGAQMSNRVMGMLMRYGEPGIRRAVPLALALTSVSNPQLSVLETLSKFSHDQDSETALAAIFGLGLVGAGTNNARLGNMLRQLAVFHARDASNLMMVRIAQGLTHLGKGTCTLSPFHMERQLMCPASLAGLVTAAFAFLDVKKTICGPRQHFLLYSLVPAIQPRHLLTFVPSSTPETSQLEPLNTSVRVGQAVDVVGQAGKPKGITGFQTQTTPVLLAHGERAELATNEYLPVSPFLEGILILKPNPDYKPSVADKPAKAKAK